MINNIRKILPFIMLSFCLSHITYATDKEEIVENIEEKSPIVSDIFKGIEECLQEIEKYVDFQNDYLSYAHKKYNQTPTNEDFFKMLNGEETNEDFIYNRNNIIEFLSSIKEDQIQIKKILTAENSIDTVLSHLLSKRFGQIAIWGEEKKYSNKNQTKISSERLQNQIDSQVTFYQFFNSLILKLYNLTTPENLSPKTRHYICLSPTLWALLQDKTTDLGTPEEALNGSKSDYCDLDFFYRYVDESESMLMSFNHWEKKVKRINVTPFQRSQWDNTYGMYEKIEELPCPSFLRKTTTIKESDIFANDVKLSKKKKKKKKKKTTKILDKEEEKSKTEESEEPKSVGGEIQNENLFLLNIEENSKNSLQSNNILETIKENPQFEEFFDKKEKKLKEEKSEKSTSNTEEAHNNLSLLNSKENPETNLTSNKIITQPRGMRLFHPHASSLSFKTNITLEELNNTQFSVLEKIFSLKGFKTVTYSDFSNLWKSINGTDSIKENTKSSHKMLLDANKKFVTSTFSHGGGMKYTKTTIPYIRNALALIGFEVGKK